MRLNIKKNIPNIITLTRLISTILRIVYFINDNLTVSIILYIYGAISDIFDGYFARKFSAYSKFGQYLDAISDKLYVLSLIVLTAIYGNYLILIPFVMELIIAIINYLIIKRKKKNYTERVGKFKTVLLFSMMIAALLSIKFYLFYYIFIILLPLVLYFQLQSIVAYINQLNGKSQEVIPDFKQKKFHEKMILLWQEFIYYLFNPVFLKKKERKNDRYKVYKRK